MRIPCAILMLSAMTCAACGSSKPAGTGASYDTSSRFTRMEHPDTEADRRGDPEGIIADPNKPITVEFVPNDAYRQGFNPVPGLEQMPFGENMFGPWRVGGDRSPANPAANAGAGGMDFTKGKSGISFVQKPLRTVLHYIAANSAGLQLITEEDAGEIRISCILPQGPYTTDEAATLIASICKSNALDFIRDGDVVIIKKRRSDKDVKRGIYEAYNVDFKDTDLVDAIMETASVSGTQVFVRAAVDGMSDEEVRNLLHQKISLEMKDAKPEAIYRKLAELGSLVLRVEELEDGTKAFKFDFPEKSDD